MYMELREIKLESKEQKFERMEKIIEELKKKEEALNAQVRRMKFVTMWLVPILIIISMAFPIGVFYL